MFRFIESFQAFIKKMKANFQRIARATKHDVTVEDLQQDAFILAEEIGRRRGKPIDFDNPEDQELIMRAVNVDNVKRGDWHLRKSIRIDQEQDEEKTTSILDRLAAQASSDPLIALLLKEADQDAEAMLANSYSEATAYVMIYVRFKSKKEEILAYLVISDRTLARRISCAADTVRLQPSLFDRIERISKDFMPQRGKGYAVREEQHRASSQWAWEF